MKKIGLILFAIVLVALVFADISWWNIPYTGTSTNSYVVIDSLITKNIGDITISIKNTGSSSNDVAYKVYRYWGSWSGVYATTRLDTLSDDEVHYYPIDDVSYGIKILIVSAVSDSHSTVIGYWDYQK